jgi:hypothetical protein
MEEVDAGTGNARGWLPAGAAWNGDVTASS